MTNKKIVLTGSEFRRLQLLQVPMLKELDRVCRANNIVYSISNGSLLGAVRHKGFIPWDDDIDVSMLREEYEKFKKVANQLDESICFFQDHTTDENYFWGYGKLRRTGTTFIRCGQSHLKFKTGVSIDIFPLDDVPLSTAGRFFQNIRLMFLRKHLYAQVAVKNEKNFFKLLFYKIMAIRKPKSVMKKYDKIASKSRNNSKNEVRTLLFPSVGTLYVKNPISKRYSMPKKWFLDLVDYQFEDIVVKGTKDYDEALYYEYRDYMTLPPENKRDPHAPCEYYDFGGLEK